MRSQLRRLAIPALAVTVTMLAATAAQASPVAVTSVTDHCGALEAPQPGWPVPEEAVAALDLCGASIAHEHSADPQSDAVVAVELVVRVAGDTADRPGNTMWQIDWESAGAAGTCTHTVRAFERFHAGDNIRYHRGCADGFAGYEVPPSLLAYDGDTLRIRVDEAMPELLAAFDAAGGARNLTVFSGLNTNYPYGATGWVLWDRAGAGDDDYLAATCDMLLGTSCVPS